MTNIMGIPSQYGLDHHGLRNLNMEYWSLTTPALKERIVSRREGILAHEGAVVVRTGHHTGRAPNDKFIVQAGEAAEKVWWGKVNRPLAPDHYQRLYLRMTAYFQGRDIFVQDTTVATHPDYRLPIRVVTETAWHSLFARNLFIRGPNDELPGHVPEFTILHAPGFRAIPEIDGTNSDIFVVINFAERLILIGGTSYAGEIKKSVFTILNYLLPQEGVLPMHCSATAGVQGDAALFFGLSGTGKTTLSSDPQRKLIGDDEHGWGDDGVFNFEGGCYAKVIHLREELEPVIWAATRHFGTILENISIDANTRRVNFDDASYTENTRAAYPIGFVGNREPSGQAGHPHTIFFLTADAFGVMPPIARLTTEQAMYYFLSGYTSKLAGTEKGLGKEPQMTFSACFGEPFMPLHPWVYAQMLGEKIRKHGATVWLVNTGWTGGAYGVGQRMPLPLTRAMISAAINGELEGVPMRCDPYFAVMVPEYCPGIPSEILDPRTTWKDGEAFDRQARLVVSRFEENFAQFMDQVPSQVAAASPAGKMAPVS